MAIEGLIHLLDPLHHRTYTYHRSPKDSNVLRSAAEAKGNRGLRIWN